MQKQTQKYCPNCRKVVDINCLKCPDCAYEFVPHHEVEDEITNTVTFVDPVPTFVWKLIGFLCPIAGLVLFIVFKEKYPNRSKVAGKAALTMAILITVIIAWLIIKRILTAKGIIV